MVDADEKVLMYHVSAVSDKIKTLGDFMPELYPMLRETLQKVLREKRVCTRQYILNGLHQRGTFVYLPEQIFGRPAMLGVGIDVDELYYLNQNEMVQMKCLQTVLPEFNANASFAAILKIFCEHLHGDRCYLIRYDLQNRSRELVEEYCAPGISALQTNFPAQVPETMDWINRNLTRTKEGHKLEHCRVSELPDSPLARYLHQQEVKDLYTMPIFLKNELWGSFGLVYKQRSGHLSPVQKQLFPMIAKMVELILLRQSYISDIAEARDAALAAAQAMRARQAEIGALLSAKADQTAVAVHRVYDEYTALKFTHFGVCSQLFDALAQLANPGEDAIRTVPGLDHFKEQRHQLCGEKPAGPDQQHSGLFQTGI